VLALWCVYQSACKVASYLLGAIVSVLKGLGTRVGAHGDRPGEGRGRAFYAKKKELRYAVSTLVGGVRSTPGCAPTVSRGGSPGRGLATH